jgi:hypothetical protein
LGPAGLSDSMPMAMLAATGAAFALMFSPLYSWVGMLFLAPLAYGLSRAGRLGWVPAALAGIVAGLCASGFVPGMTQAVPAGFGLLAAVVLRGSLFLLAPDGPGQGRGRAPTPPNES